MCAICTAHPIQCSINLTRYAKSKNYEAPRYIIKTIIFTRFIHLEKLRTTESSWRDIELCIDVVHSVYACVIDPEVLISIHSRSVVLFLSPVSQGELRASGLQQPTCPSSPPPPNPQPTAMGFTRVQYRNSSVRTCLLTRA
jgi:hypothetical protein